MKIYSIFLILLIFLLSCTLKQQEKIGTTPIYPTDTILMQYNQDNFYTPILAATVNDSLHCKAFFDTGVPSKYLYASNSLKELFVDNTALVQIGKQTKQLEIELDDRNGRSIFDVIGKNTIIVGWEFFENKIIEFSFDHQYILVYDELPDVTEYLKTKITVLENSWHYRYLVVPIKVMLQGKTIEDTACIDTGNNSYANFSIDLVEKYGIDTAQAYH